MRVLSMGAGVQTTACLLPYHKEYDAVIFADTGDEYPETYWYIENCLKPFCRRNDVKWVTVKHPNYDSLSHKCLSEKRVPVLRSRNCTDQFKVQPINRELRKMGATKENPITVDIGFSLDESHRLNNMNYQRKYERFNYPLLNDKITREQCKKIIRQHGFDIPVKSGCTFCGFQSVHAMRKLQHEHPDLYKIGLEMERISGYTLRMDGKKLGSNDNNTIDQFCDSGHCFV